MDKRNLTMFAVSRLAKSSLFILLAVTLTTAAHAGGGHSGSNASNGSPIVRDHRGSEDEIGNTVGGPCYGGCVGQGGLGDTRPAQNQDHGTGNGTPKVTDHRTGH
jgi:hypothetical protein